MSDDYYDPYDYSDDFNYYLWTEGTVATLTNVPWDAAYRDTVRFPTRTDLDAYIDQVSTSLSISDMTYAKPGVPVTLPITINAAMRYNYLRVVNENIPGGGDVPRAYYYFVTAIDFASPGATRLTLQLDVFQTFIYDVQFENSYIERGHIGIANERDFEHYGRSFLTTPEGLDGGGEYRVFGKRSQSVMSGSAGTGENNEIDILVCSTVDLTRDPGTVEAPRLNSATGDNLQGLPSGASFYAFQTLNQFREFMRIYGDKPWVTQGIISITAVPNLERYGYTLTQVPHENPRVQMFTINAPGGQGKEYDLWPRWRDELKAALPARYRHLRKFLTSPYTMVEITTFTGMPIVLKPEMWQTPSGAIMEKASLAPPSQRVVFSPRKYNTWNEEVGIDRSNGQSYDDNGEYLNLATQISNFPSFALVNNGAIGFLAANKNGLAFQQQAADWSQQRALNGAQTAYGQASAGMHATGEQGRIARSADASSTIIANDVATLQAITGAGMALGGGLTSGNPVGAAGGVMGAVSTGLNSMIQQSANNQQWGVRNSAAIESQTNALGLAGYNRDTNRDLAEFGARGDYAQAIAGINAKVRDAQLTQPSTSGQVGGEAFNMIHGSAVISMRVKIIGENELAVIGEYWLRYGYAVRRFGRLPADLMCMSKFTYWKLTETYLTGAIPEQFKQTIRGIFEKGVTVWRSPDYVGKIDLADNTPVGGIRL
jgi:hypothetical protein